MNNREVIWGEMDRLTKAGLSQLGYTELELERAAELTYQINQRKSKEDVVIPAHVYQRAEILYGVADFVGDSLKLSRLCAESPAKKIVFCGVRFMAETAKILSPDKEVFLPALEAGCSLADSITREEICKLKSEYPGVPVVSYINTTAEVKAESDVIVTSANASKILQALFQKHDRIIFLPDEWMGRNLARELNKKVGEELIIHNGKCIVHEGFDPGAVEHYRRQYPGVKILAHTECSPALVAAVDFAGGTGDMLKYIKNTSASSYMLVTECGLGDMARAEFPDRHFIPMCRLCPYMKATDLAHVLKTLETPSSEQRIELPPELIRAARRPLDRMFELST
ncbi:MAG: quinolinate synthase NadA [Elusimicrobia bacterium]|nr:quinolinate synthase NadA [Elusimicrobiota bacterium]